MSIKRDSLLIIGFLLSMVTCKQPDTTPVNRYLDNPQHISVLTQHNDNTRAGLNSQETLLTTTNVNSQSFGKLFTLQVDNQVYAQPLVVGSLTIASGNHNVVFIATVSNTLYAFDGDTGTLYWTKNFTQPGMRTPKATDMKSSWCSPYTNITSNIGIVGTPVIDPTTNTIYFVARSTDGTHFFQHLHAVSIVTGDEQSGSPIEIKASIAGSGDGSVNGIVSFDPLRNNQRQGLVLVGSTVYIAYASHCDWNPFHGWILGYDSKTLEQKIVYNVTPDGEEGGLWQSGMGIAADDQGNLFVVSGNGTVGKKAAYVAQANGTAEDKASSDPTDLSGRSESAMKLTPAGSTLQVTSYFTPSNYLNLNVNDLDYGVMGSFLIPNSNLYFTGGKDGNLFLLNKDNMGGYVASANNVQQTIPINANLHCQPSYYKGSSKEFIFVWSENDQLRGLQFDRTSNKITNQVASNAVGPSGQSGAVLSVSSNGTTDGTGILWASYSMNGDAESNVTLGILRAFDASNITKELWNSTQTNGDDPGAFAKFCSPTVANGHVYLATFSSQVVVYGLK